MASVCLTDWQYQEKCLTNWQYEEKCLTNWQYQKMIFQFVEHIRAGTRHESKEYRDLLSLFCMSVSFLYLIQKLAVVLSV